MDGTEGLPIDETGLKLVKRPRRNRVSAFGTIEATHHKGTLMGNRGDLHAPNGTLGRQWRSTRWLSCILDGGGWKAPMDEPGRNYPLFFHDEAVALAAGHRPCGQCRPAALAKFISAWKIGQGLRTDDWVPFREIDRQLHRARVTEHRHRQRVAVDSLPNGVFVWSPTTTRFPLMVFDQKLWPWEHGGYGPALAISDLIGPAYQLTSAPIIAAMRGGYEPIIHPGLQLVANSMSR